ncbi:family 78 glycoside hydrolase catalytic domain [Siphonobacter sp. SORGH_AS_0500]|uniref:alpha-L-rhamnosidase n=2 Tax=Siphonobacter sp. SORGH_AS_0500 TaxID=1864824 RepID=UPI002857B909|nr:family 78 glycoside hydrolase catalytic domain [Siphonobacter sp. SORGH_AS_0500]MDR6194987.1 alpha-L-rhamnosidase [Siphonobacter sp. SORGH_AS_0500]
MKAFYIPLLFLASHALLAQPTKLQSEYLTNPLGIDTPQPRLTWQLQDSRKGARQTAYQIFVSTDSAQVQKGEVWKTAKVAFVRNLVTYEGSALKPYTKYYWAVQTWDQDGKPSGLSSIASFETGHMNQQNWKGSWISDARDVTIKPAPYFRKSFQTTKRVRSARAYIAAAGLYELYLNGQKIGNHRLDPMYTRFDRRTLYVTYDVTKQIQEGKNAVGVLLGNGWYNHQSTAVWYFHQAPWRSRPSVCVDLRVTYEDGTTETISSDTSWKTALSPVIFNSIYTAEHYDARKEQKGWNTAAFDDSKWKNAINRPAPSLHIVAQALHPIRNVEALRPVSMVHLDDTTWVYDFGRNISGVTELKLKGNSGTMVRLKHGERLLENGRVDLSNIDAHYRPTDNTDPFQVDVVTLSGREDEFMPKFNYKGFQYVEITSRNRDLDLTPANLMAYFMHSDVPPVGKISSSNPTLDKLWWATNNSYLSNLFGYPTDCPQREKNGWTGDGQIAVETGLYSYDGITIYEKWLADHRDEQQPNGILPAIIPTSGWGYDWANGPDWTSTIAIIPWNLYLFYGDKKPLEDNYENMKRYVDHITDIAPNGLTSWGLGDWIPVKSQSPVELTSSIYYFVDATIVSNAAGLLGKPAEQQLYASLAKKIQDAINDKYLNKETGVYGSGLQTEQAVPLQWGVVPENLKSKVAAHLAKRVAADGNSLDVGLLGTKAILNALSENGYADVAYTLASKETYPSWGWWIKNGATTLYENWDIQAKSDISLNHIMFGEIGAWLYKGLGGIKPDPENPGFKNVWLRPNFVKNLDQFEAEHEGPYGKIVSSWKRSGTIIEYKVTIPANSTASVFINSKKVKLDGMPIVGTDSKQGFRLLTGNYTFLIEE